eukprot:m.237680 g.237680  ORF g.237680 m.237680 type:complete len:402 (-) comp18958_c1_seq6:336-1541(-)
MRGCLNTHTASRLPGCPESPLTRTRNCIFLTPNGTTQVCAVTNTQREKARERARCGGVVLGLSPDSHHGQTCSGVALAITTSSALRVLRWLFGRVVLRAAAHGQFGTLESCDGGPFRVTPWSLSSRVGTLVPLVVGTTALLKPQCDRHLVILMSIYLFWIAGIKQFWRHWPEQVCAKCQIVDGTPNYLPTPEVPARIAETFPEWRHKLRFAMVLRDPVERAESHWGHASRLAKSSHSVAWATNLVEGHTLSSKTKMCNKTHIGCLRRFGPSLGPKDDLVGYASCMRGCQLLTYGLYDAQVAAWYNHFDPRQFCIITSEYLKEHTQEAVHRVAAFFHLDTLKFPPAMKAHGRSHEHKDVVPALEHFYNNQPSVTRNTANSHGGWLGCAVDAAVQAESDHALQ